MIISRLKDHLIVPTELKQFIEQVHDGLKESLSKPGPVLIVAHGGVYLALCYLLNIATIDWTIDDMFTVNNCTPVRFYKDTHDQSWKVEKITK